MLEVGEQPVQVGLDGETGVPVTCVMRGGSLLAGNGDLYGDERQHAHGDHPLDSANRDRLRDGLPLQPVHTVRLQTLVVGVLTEMVPVPATFVTRLARSVTMAVARHVPTAVGASAVHVQLRRSAFAHVTVASTVSVVVDEVVDV